MGLAHLIGRQKNCKHVRDNVRAYVDYTKRSESKNARVAGCASG